MEDKERELIRGARLGCRYSYRCNELRELDFPELETERFILTSAMLWPSAMKSRLPRVLEILKKLTPYYYYQLIAFLSGRTDFFSQDIVRAYWLGNGTLLSPLTETNITAFLEQGKIPETEQVVPGPISRVRSLEGGLPHHNFDVLLRVKETRSFTPRLLMDLNRCLIKPGLVVRFQEMAETTLLHVKTIAVAEENGDLVLGEVEEFVAPGFVKRIKPGQHVALHLGWAREKIDSETAENLRALTKEALAFIQRRDKHEDQGNQS